MPALPDLFKAFISLTIFFWILSFIGPIPTDSMTSEIFPLISLAGTTLVTILEGSFGFKSSTSPLLKTIFGFWDANFNLSCLIT